MVGSASNKGKFGKARRGTGRHFTNPRQLSGRDAFVTQESSEESSASSEESEEESEDDPSGQRPKLDADGQVMKDKLGNIILEDAPQDEEPEMSRAEKKAAAIARAKAGGGRQGGGSKPNKAAKDDSSDEDDKKTQKPKKEQGKSVRIGGESVGEAASPKTSSAQPKAPRELSRREREEKAKKEAKERYMAAHLAGKTDEAKADLARLKAVRAQREAAAAQRAAENEERERQKQAQLEASARKRSGRS